MLHVFDPRALHSIFVKDAEYYPHDLNPSKSASASSV